LETQTGDPAKDGWQLTDAYRRYALGLMLAIYVVNFVDRQIFAILIEPIKADIHLTDTQLGFLGGIAFAIFYTFAGIPIARWADKGSRRNIVTLALLIWSCMTAVTGLARNFWMLLVARVGVGIGEAGCSPPIHSLISDYFPPERRGTALSTYALGIPIGGAIGTLAGGWIGEYFGWRTAFLVVGIPGIILAIVTRLTLREPPRGFSDGVEAKPAVSTETSVMEVFRFLWRLKSFRHLSFAAALHGFVGYGVGLFIPSFFIRIHGFGLAETSTYLFLIGLTGMIGTFSGGYLSDRIGRDDKRWYMWIPGMATIGAVPFAVLFYTTQDPMLALFLAVPGAILGPMYLGPSFAMTQALVTPGMRALASALLLFILNIIGLGLGPWFVGFLSDYLNPIYGVQSLRYALFWVAVVGGIWAALHYYLASLTLNSDLQARNSL
jgi:predicted MFS family arabinose efflux permease